MPEEFTPDRALDTMSAGITLLVIQNYIVLHPFFNDSEIKKYLKIRKKFHPEFSQACVVVASTLESNSDSAHAKKAASELRKLASLPKSKVSLMLRRAARVLKPLSRLSPKESGLPHDMRYRQMLRSLQFLADLEEEEDYKVYRRELTEVLNNLITKYTEYPTKIRSLFRLILKIGVGSLEVPTLRSDAEPGVWFDLDSEEKEYLKEKANQLEKERKALLKSDPKPGEEMDANIQRLNEIKDEFENIQREAGVPLWIVTREDDQPIEDVLDSQENTERDGITEFLVQKLLIEVERIKNEYADSSTIRSRRELGKIATQISQAKSVGTLERVLSEGTERKILSSLQGEFHRQFKIAEKNLVLAKGQEPALLEYEPIDAPEFATKHKVGEIEFSSDFSEEEKREVLGRVSRAFEDLETIFGKGFCGKHGVPLKLSFGNIQRFSSKASYFAYHDSSRFQPEVRFGKDYEGLMAHELSHFLDDALKYQLEQNDPEWMEWKRENGLMTSPMSSSITGSETSVRADYYVKTVKDPDRTGKWLTKLKRDLPEVIEFYEVIVETEDFQRWNDKLGGAYEGVLAKAITNVTGLSWDDDDEFRSMVDAKYKSELSPEIVEEAKRLYRDVARGDTRKLNYYVNLGEIWARMLEQYVYTKLAEDNITNPWLTQMTYDVDEMDQFMAQETFETKVLPILDSLFSKLKGRDILAMRLASRFLSSIK